MPPPPAPIRGGMVLVMQQTSEWGSPGDGGSQGKRWVCTAVTPSSPLSWNLRSGDDFLDTRGLFLTLFFHRLLLSPSILCLPLQWKGSHLWKWTLRVISNFSFSLMPTFNWSPSSLDSIILRFLATFSRHGLECPLSPHTSLRSACLHTQKRNHKLSCL